MKTLAITLLAIIAFLTGGCSIVSLAAFGSSSFPLSLPGLLAAVVCVMVIKALTANPP